MKIKLFGKDYTIGFNMAVQIRFEELSGKPFDLGDKKRPGTLTTQTATMQLCYASLKESNDNLPFTFDEMLKRLTMSETADLKNAVIEAMNEWFGIPKVMQEDEQTQEKEDEEKNA